MKYHVYKMHSNTQYVQKYAVLNENDNVIRGSVVGFTHLWEESDFAPYRFGGNTDDYFTPKHLKYTCIGTELSWEEVLTLLNNPEGE